MTEIEFEDTLGIDLSLMTELSSGVWILDEVLGTDTTVAMSRTVAEGDSVEVTYTGFVRTGEIFAEQGTPTRWELAYPLIPGLRSGLVGMMVDGTRLVVMPPEEAYGSRQLGTVIYPGAVLLFRVTLLSIPPG